jgi:hypothetical protein
MRLCRHAPAELDRRMNGYRTSRSYASDVRQHGKRGGRQAPEGPTCSGQNLVGYDQGWASARSAPKQYRQQLSGTQSRRTPLPEALAWPFRNRDPTHPLGRLLDGWGSLGI